VDGALDTYFGIRVERVYVFLAGARFPFGVFLADFFFAVTGTPEFGNCDLTTGVVLRRF